jgi:hypothetical protein
MNNYISNNNIELFKWLDNTPVYMISCLHSSNNTHAVEREIKDEKGVLPRFLSR